MKRVPLDYLALYRAEEHGDSLVESAPDRVHQLIATHHLRALLAAADMLIAMRRIACCDKPEHRHGHIEGDETATLVECSQCEMGWTGEDYALLTKRGGPFADA